VSVYEALGVLFGVISVWLTVRENVWCWPTGIVNVALSGIVFFEARLYADMSLQAVYVVLSLYGWYEWLYGGKNRAALEIARAPRLALVVSLGCGVAGVVAIERLLAVSTDAALPFWDATTTSFSLVAQFLLTKKWIENWLVWIVVDVIYVPMYLGKHLYGMAGLYLVFLGLATLGLLQWKKTLASTVPA
jgi:nicotinamide mononucleotide transporter